MIESSINLVSEEVQRGRLEKEKSSRLKLLSIVAVIASLAITMALVFAYLLSAKKLSSIEEEKSFLTQRIEANREVEKLVLGVEERAEVFNSLYSGRRTYSVIIAKIAELLPEEVVLGSLSFDASSVSLAGETSSYAALAKFIQESNKEKKQKSDSFPFELISLKQASLDSQTGKVKFTISLTLSE